MIRRSFHYLWSVRAELAKYVVVGLSGVLLDIGSLKLLEHYGLSPTLAIVVNQVFLLAYNFSLNKYWSFANRDMPHKQLVRYLTLASWNYAFSVFAMYVGNEHFGFDSTLVRVVTIAIMTLWNFFLYKYWVYRVTEPVYKSA